MNDESRPIQAAPASTGVPAHTGVEFSAPAGDAGRRRDRIKLLLSAMTTTTEKIAGLLDAAQAEQDHVALGYASWPAYMAGEYTDALAGLSTAARRPAVVALAEGGLSTRAIAEIAGVGQSTVGRDLQVTRSGSPGEAGPVRSAKLEQRREFFDSDEEMRDVDVMADASDDNFEAALTAAREQDDLSRGNVVANLPDKRVTGTDGKSYPATTPAPAKPPRRSPLPDSYRRATWELRKSIERLEKLHTDDRFQTNRKDLADNGGVDVMVECAHHLQDLGRHLSGADRQLGVYRARGRADYFGGA